MANHEERSHQPVAIEDRYAGYNVYDPNNERIGKVDDIFLDESDQLEYIGVKVGVLGTRSTLIPAEIARFDDEQQRVQVSQQKSVVKDGPSFDDDSEITPEYEQQVRDYYGLGAQEGGQQRGAYDDYYGDETDERSGKVGPGMREGDIESGKFRGHSEADEGVNQAHGSDLEDRDELRVQRSEEELRAGTREREAGKVGVRKRVRTEREQIRVPKRREEVMVDRVAVNDREAAPGEIGEDEVEIPVVEEEVVTDKRAVVKEEIRLRKESVREEEVVEEDVRKEEVDLDEQTERGRGLDEDAGRGRGR